MAILLDFDTKTFNDLPEIEEASASLISRRLINSMLETIGTTFVEHGLNEAWGVCILHKHWQLEDKELPLQVPSATQANEFVSRPAMQSEVEMYPLVYRIEAGYLRPMEFSTDHSTREANNQLLANPAGIHALITSMNSLGFSEHFGLFALKPLSEESELVEFNFAGRVSIVREMRQGDVALGALIETTWRFYPTLTAGLCKTKCMGSCSVTDDGHTPNAHQVYHDPNG